MDVENRGSVTLWIDGLRAGDPEAARQLWRRYFESLVRLARSRLRSTAGGMADEEDVALSAFDNFCAGMKQGRYPDLADRDDLWRLLMTIAAHKALNQRRWESRQKRGGGQVRHASARAAAAGPAADDLTRVVGPEPTPEFAAMVAEECARRLDGLPDASLRQMAVLKMEGYGNEEIAARLGCGLRTVARRLKVIRRAWQDEVSP